MASQESINSFEKGMDRDSSNLNKPKNTYEYAENLINNSEDNKYCLTPENGIVANNPDIINLEDPANWITIGNTYIDNIEILYQGHLDTINQEFDDSRIAVKEIKSGKFYVVYTNHEKLNFKIDYHVNNPQAKKVYNGDINLYFTDWVNSPKFIRLVYSSDTSTDPYIVEQDVANLNADFEEPLIDFTSQTDSGGQAPIGTVHFFLQYIDRYGNSTRFSNLTNGIPVIGTIRSAQHASVYTTNYSGSTSVESTIPYGKVTSGNYGDLSTKQIRITIDHVDTNYAYIKLGYMYYTDSVYTPTYKLIDRLYTIPPSTGLHTDDYVIDVTFFETTSDLDENQVTQIAKKFEYTHAKCIAQHQNYLLLGNLKNKYEAVSDLIYEQICNQIDVRTATKILTTTTDTYDSTDLDKCYDHEQSNFRYKSYKRAEVYSLGLRFIYKGGYKTKVYHIPAKERVTEYNSNILYNLPISGDSLTGTFYSSELYKADSGYINSSNGIANIRHHVMPDFYHDDGISPTYRLSNASFFINDTNTVNALGLYFDNIQINTLPDNVKDDIVGIEFVRQTREAAQNKRIVCQGINRSIQRPLSRSGNYPVVVDPISGLAVPFNASAGAKDYPFALQGGYQPFTGSEINVSPSDGNYPWDVLISPDSYFHNDGLSAHSTGKYGSIGKKCDEFGWINSSTNSITAPLDSFGHINSIVMPSTGTPSTLDYTSYDEFALNIISPETEFNLIPLISSYKVELRDRLHFRTFDVYSGTDSGGHKGSLVPINNSIGDVDYNNFVFGTRGGGSLRSLDDASYNYSSGLGPDTYRTKLLQYTTSSHVTILVAEPLISQNTEGFNSVFKSPTLLTVRTDTDDIVKTQDILDISLLGLTIDDTFSGNNVDIEFLVKHCYMNNGLYLIPDATAIAAIKPYLKAYTNNNLRYEIRFTDDDTYFAEQGLTANTNLAFGNITTWKKLYRKDKIISTSSVKPYATCTDIEKLDVDYSSTLVFDVISEIQNQYGSIYNAEYFPITVSYDIDKVNPTKIGSFGEPIFSGDVFVCWYGNNNGGYGENYSIKSGFASGGTASAAFDDNWLLHKIHCYNNNIMYFPVETSVNTYYRNVPIDGVPYFPNTTIEDAYDDIENIYLRSPHFNSDSYNLPYSFNQNNINLSTAENELTSTQGSFGRYPDRIIYSEKSVDGEIDDRFRSFLTENFKDIPKDTGEIWNLWQFQNDIYAHTENALWKTSMLERTALSTNNGDEVVLGTSSLFAQPPQRIITKQGASGGTKSSWAYIITPFGLVFWDTNGRKVYKLSGDNQLEEISFDGMMSNFFNTNGDFLTERGSYREETHYLDDTPFNPYGHGWHFGYDDFNKRILITKRSGILSEQKSPNMRYNNERNEFFKEFTISYSFLTNSWLSFSSYLPLKYLNSNNYVISIPDPLKEDLVANNTNFIGYHTDNENPCKFYGLGTEDSILIYNINDYPQLEKVFDNIFISMYNYSQVKVVGPDTFSKTLTPNRGNTIDPLTGVEIKDTLEVETSNQYSGVIDLMYNHSTADHFKYYNDSKRNVKYYNKEYRIALPKARTINQIIDKDFPTNYYNGAAGYNVIGDRFKDKYLKVTLRWRNYERFSFVINFIKNIFRINYR